jgi:wyosine [tRNA(Phe)-imidazoG37] synthetase (radical SAM superfamily)
MENKIVFGPVPSRRLGQSLGINNIPPKICSYSCVYCQVGITKALSVKRRIFYPVEKIVSEVRSTLANLETRKEKIDFITFVPDGEPTLDANLGKEIEEIRKFTSIKIAVITNASLLWQEEVRQDLNKADLVSIKMDTVEKSVWEKIDRPSPALDFDILLDGVKRFAKEFKGSLLSETLMVKDINDTEEGLIKTAGFLSIIKPAVAYIGIATRPPAEGWVVPPDEEKITRAYQIFKEYKLNAELIIGGVDGSFGFTGDIQKDILNTVSVHPMTKQQIETLLKKAGSSWTLIEQMLKEKRIKEIDYRNQKYYLKNFTLQ